MESIFENEYTHTEDYYSEYLSYLYFKKPIMMILHIIFVLLFILGILCALFPIFFQVSQTSIIVFIIAPIIFLSADIYKFYKAKAIAYKRDQEIGKGKLLEIKLFVTENEIYGISNFSDLQTSIELSKIKKVVQTKNYYICISEAKLTYDFKKDSFTKGTTKEFEQFLKNKGFRL